MNRNEHPGIDPLSHRRSRPDDEARDAQHVLLNDIGITNMEQGLNEEAEQLFLQALWSFHEIQKYPWILIVPNRIEEEENSNAGSSAWEYCGHNRGSQHPYDEGLRLYPSPLHVCSALPAKATYSIIFYNIGQSYVARSKHLTAMAWFELARGILENKPGLEAVLIDKSTDSIHILKIIHNLGYCAHCSGRMKESMAYYQQALECIRKLRLSSFDMARTLNCIALLHWMYNTDKESNDSSNDIAIDMFSDSLIMLRVIFGGQCHKDVATVLNNLGRVYFLRSEYRTALAAYKESLEIRKKVLGISVDVAATTYNIGQTYHRLGEMDQALIYYQEFLEFANRPNIPIEHREVVDVHISISEIYCTRGEWTMVRKVLLEALRVARNRLGGCHPYVVLIIKRLGFIHFFSGDVVEAVRFFKEGIRVEQAGLGFGFPWVMMSLRNLAQFYCLLGEYTTAHDIFHQMYIMLLQDESFRPNEIAYTLMNMGRMKYRMRAYDSAVETLQKASQFLVFCHRGSECHPDVAFTLHAIGLIYFERQEYKGAIRFFAKAAQIHGQCCQGRELFDNGILLFNLATAYFEAGEEEMAVGLYARAIWVEQTALSLHCKPDGNRNSTACSCPSSASGSPLLANSGDCLRPRDLASPDGIGAHAMPQEAIAVQEAAAIATEELTVMTDETSLHRRVTHGRQLNIIGNIHLQRGDVGEMMKYYTQASRIYNRCGLSDSALVISGYNIYSLSRLYPRWAPAA